MLRRTLALTGALVCALTPSAASAATIPDGPEGDAFYRPPADLVPGPEGTVIWKRPATGLADVSGAARTTVVLYRSRAQDGTPIAVSGSVVIPRGAPPAGGWPVAAWSHVTTGAADTCAPSRAAPGNPELERMIRSNHIVRRYLRAGIAVVRSDYEGIGTPGPHPYLIGRSLARATVDMVRAGLDLDPRLSARYVASGHSEGGVASLFTAQYGPAMAPELDLRGAAAVTPPVAAREIMDVARRIPVANDVVGGLAALGSLILAGAGTTDPHIDALLREGGLGPRATGLLADIETRCLAELSERNSWAGLVPAAIPGPRWRELRDLLYPVLDANDVRRADVGRIPIRLDVGVLDGVAPITLTRQVARAQRARGADLVYREYALGTHPNMTDDAFAGPPVVAWSAARLR